MSCRAQDGIGGQKLIRLRLADFSNLISLEMPGANTDGLLPPHSYVELVTECEVLKGEVSARANACREGPED